MLSGAFSTQFLCKGTPYHLCYQVFVLTEFVLMTFHGSILTAWFVLVRLNVKVHSQIPVHGQIGRARVNRAAVPSAGFCLQNLGIRYLTTEGASTIVVYGKHFFLYNFLWSLYLKPFAILNWTYLQKEDMVKIWAIITKPFSRYETCSLANVTFFDGHKIPFLSIKHNVHLKNTILSLKSKLIIQNCANWL